MAEYTPILIAGAIIGVFSLFFFVAYLFLPLDSQSPGCLQGDSSIRVRYTGEWTARPREHSLPMGSVKRWGKF